MFSETDQVMFSETDQVMFSETDQVMFSGTGQGQRIFLLSFIPSGDRN